MKVHAVLLGMLLAGDVAAGTSFYVQHLPTPEFSGPVVLALRASDSPRERALGAILDARDNEPRVERGRMLRAAAQAAPDDLFVQATWALAYDDASGCDAASPCPERARAWARVEPDNGSAWLAALDHMDSDKDQAAINEVLARMADAERFDEHYVDAAALWASLLAAHSVPTDVAQAQSLYYAAMMHPPVDKLVQACKRELHPDAPPRRFEQCTRIGRKMARLGTSMMAQRVGHRLLQIARLGNGDDAEAYRVFAWLEHSQFELGEELESAQEIRQIHLDLQKAGSEPAAIALALQRHGISLDPPAGWRNPN